MGARIIKKVWWVDFRFNRARYRKRSPENSKAGAQAYEASLRGKLTRGEDIDTVAKKEVKQKFSAFTKEWFNNYVKTNNKYSEIRGKQIILDKHLIPFFGNLDLEAISSLQIEQFKSQKISEGLKNKTINNYLTVLNTCLTHAKEWEIIDKQPKIKKLKVAPPKTSFLSEEDCQLLLNNTTGIWHDTIFLVLKTGIRFGELRALRWEDINWEKKILSVKRSIFRGIIVSPKSNKERYIYLLDEVLSLLGQYRKKKGYVFTLKDDQVIEENKLRRELWRAGDRAGIEPIGWHLLRHTFASHLAMKGAPLKSIQELLGHANITTTMRYAHLSSLTLQNSIELLGDGHKIENFGQQMGNDNKINQEFRRVFSYLNLHLESNLKQKTEL